MKNIKKLRQNVICFLVREIERGNAYDCVKSRPAMKNTERKPNMTEILYYPVVDCDVDGTEKIAMIPTTDVHSVKAQSRMWLAEMLPNYFRLYSKDSHHNTDDFTVRCPRCGKVLNRISQNVTETKLGLYECRACRKI